METPQQKKPGKFDLIDLLFLVPIGVAFDFASALPPLGDLGMLVMKFVFFLKGVETRLMNILLGVGMGVEIVPAVSVVPSVTAFVLIVFAEVKFMERAAKKGGALDTVMKVAKKAPLPPPAKIAVTAADAAMKMEQGEGAGSAAAGAVGGAMGVDSVGSVGAAGGQGGGRASGSQGSSRFTQGGLRVDSVGSVGAGGKQPGTDYYPDDIAGKDSEKALAGPDALADEEYTYGLTPGDKPLYSQPTSAQPDAGDVKAQKIKSLEKERTQQKRSRRAQEEKQKAGEQL